MSSARRPSRTSLLALTVAVATAFGSSALASGEPAPVAPTPTVTDIRVDDDGEHGNDHRHEHDGDHDHGPVDPLEGSDLDVLQGAAAVDRLVSAGRLSHVAADVGIVPEQLVEELTSDPSLFLTDSGRLGYAEALESYEGSSATPSTALPLSVDVGALASKPTSTRVIHLDFDGHVSDDSAWASLPNVPSTISSAPFDLDGSPGFSTAEQALIFEVWQRVSEDYLPFDVNVTTADPGVEALRKTNSSDASYGQRMVITPSNWVGVNTLGVALLASFDDPADRPAYVFTSGYSTAKMVAEAVSHEAGHTFGLLHDAQFGTSYYDGHGVWAPIMGRGIDPAKPVTQWSRGEYAGADNDEDDLGIIASFTGYRPDDHGGDSASATVVASTSTTRGVIGRSDDRDVFAVQVGSGTLSVTLRPPPSGAAWSNLLARLIVRDSAGAVVATGAAARASSWSVRVNAAVTAGRYTIEVTPVGWLTATDGFTTYGSLGAYELLVSASSSITPPAADATTFSAVPPSRLVDTRSGIGGVRRLAAGQEVVVQVTNGTTVPSTATAAVFSIAAVGPSAEGYLTAYPCSDRRPGTSTVNYRRGQTVANTTIAALSSAGQLCVWTFADTDVLVDITGWLGPGGVSRFTPVAQRRVVDTRSGTGGVRLAAGATLSVDLSRVLPAGSTAVALNATAVGAAEPGYLTVFPCGRVPPTSTVNYAAGEARPNNTIVGLSGGRICVYSFAATDVLIDVTGAFGPTGLSYKPTPPTRVLDTRRGLAPLTPGSDVRYDVTARALGTDQPVAAFVNVTATDHTTSGYVTTYDCGVRRETSTVNQQVGQVAANGANVALAGTQSCAWLFGGGHLIVDLNGWWIR